MVGLAGFIATALAAALDPPVLLFGIIAGLSGVTVRRFLAAFAVFGSLTHLFISLVVWYGQFQFGENVSYLEIVATTAAPRLFGFLIVMLIAAALAALGRRFIAFRQPW